MNKNPITLQHTLGRNEESPNTKLERDIVLQGTGQFAVLADVLVQRFSSINSVFRVGFIIWALVVHKTPNLPFCDTSILANGVVYDHLNLVLAMPKSEK